MAMRDALEGVILFFQRISSYVNTLVIALVILLAGFILGRILDRILHKTFLRTSFDDVCFRIFRRRRNYARALRRGIVYLVYAITVYLAFRELHLDRFAVSLVLSVFLLIVVVSLVLAGIDLVPNMLAYRKLRARKIVETSRVEISDGGDRVRGTVTKMTLLDVHVKCRNGDVVFFPNAALLRAKIVMKK